MNEPDGAPAVDGLGFDPTASVVVQRFRDIQMRTECTFAATSIMWGCPDWNQDQELEGNVDRVLPTLRVFTEVSEKNELDGLVLELPGTYGATVERLAGATRRVLRHISDHDPAGPDCMAEEIEDPRWWFSFGGQKLFLLTFGPCYPPTSSRYGFQTDRAYIIFQPIHCFSRRISDGAAHKSRQARSQMRRRFEEAGRPYDLSITLSPLEADRYVKPARLGDPPVRWWKEPL